MVISIRIDPLLDRRLSRAAEARGETKSELVRRWLTECLDRQGAGETPWELGKELFGKHASGRSDLSTRRKAILRKKLRG